MAKKNSLAGRREPGYMAEDYSLTVPKKSFGPKRKKMRRLARIAAVRRCSGR